MRGEALQITHGPATTARFDSTYHLLASILSRGEADGPTIEAVVGRARVDAARAVATGRATAGDERVHAYTLLYDRARDEADRPHAGHAPVEGGTRWERAFAAMLRLRHRQRTALALYYVCGEPMSSVARVLGTPERSAREIVEAGVAATVRTLHEPVDVRRALRTAGHRLILPAVVHVPTDEPPRVPRAVVRRLLEPLEPDAAAPDVGEMPDRAEPSWEPDRYPVVALSWPPRGAMRKLVAVAAVVLVAAAMFSPAAARTTEVTVAGMTARAPAAQQTLHAPARVVTHVAPRIYVVRPGDSLWRIAGATLGDPMRWRALWRANRRVIGRTPDAIDIGWRLRLPRR